MTSTLGRRSAAAAVTVLFAMNGALVGVFGGTLPALRGRIGAGSGGVSVLLFCFAGAAVASMQAGGRMSDSLGARRVALASAPLLIAGIQLLAFARSLPAAAAAVLLAGAGNGAMDVSMNALGVQVERARPRPIMSFFHAFFSIGNLSGAAVVVAVAQLTGRSGGAVVVPSLLTVGAVTVASYAVVLRIAPAAPPVGHLAHSGRGRLPVVAFALGAMAFAFGLAEGTAVDWSSIHVTDVAGIDPAHGALGLVAVSGCMVLIRLTGDRVVASYGRRRVVRAGGAVAVAGYLVVLVATPLPVLLAGWALVGLGVGLIAPQVYAAAGHAGGGRLLAVVVTFGYAAFLVGPAVIGALAGWLGIQHAMALPLLLAATIVVLAGTLPRS
jgi:MFS family permease